MQKFEEAGVQSDAYHAGCAVTIRPPVQAASPNALRPGTALRSKTWFEHRLLGCMLSAGREVKMKILICTLQFGSKRARACFGQFREN